MPQKLKNYNILLLLFIKMFQVLEAFVFLTPITWTDEDGYVTLRTTHHSAEKKWFSTLKRTKTDNTQPKLNVVCFVVQSCLTDTDFVIPSNYCLIGTRGNPCFYRFEIIKISSYLFSQKFSHNFFVPKRINTRGSLRGLNRFCPCFGKYYCKSAISKCYRKN